MTTSTTTSTGRAETSRAAAAGKEADAGEEAEAEGKEEAGGEGVVAPVKVEEELAMVSIMAEGSIRKGVVRVGGCGEETWGLGLSGAGDSDWCSTHSGS